MRLKFSDLFEGLGSGELRYGPNCEALAGREVVIRGWLAPGHGPGRLAMLVHRPGACPDCEPVAAIALPGFRMPRRAGAVTLRGRLSYGFAVVEGAGSFLRLEQARLSFGL